MPNANDNKYVSLPNLEVYTEEVRRLIQRMIAESSEFEIVTEDSYLDFPVIGNEHHIYIDKNNNAIYRWNDIDLHYYCVGRDFNSIGVIDSNWE